MGDTVLHNSYVNVNNSYGPFTEDSAIIPCAELHPLGSSEVND